MLKFQIANMKTDDITSKLKHDVYFVTLPFHNIVIFPVLGEIITELHSGIDTNRDRFTFNTSFQAY